MTSKERHEARYQRRKAERMRRVRERSERHTKDVFSPAALSDAYKDLRKKTGWKRSVQIYGESLVENSVKASETVLSGSWKSKGFREFDIMERGKKRHIITTNVEEKCIQKTFCDNCLVPILKSYLIYDNSATIKGKGTDFALNRLTDALRHHYRRYGREGWIFFFDFKNFFGNIDNSILNENVQKKLYGSLYRNMYHDITFSMGERGLGLGSQVSQISAVFFPNAVDHAMKDHLGVHGYGRYCDDGYAISRDKETIMRAVNALEAECKKLNITLNRKKCQIIRLTRPFRFLKVRFRMLESGEILRKINRDGVKREHRRLRKYRKMLLNGEMTIEEVRLSFHSWLCSQKRGKGYMLVKDAIEWYNKLFSGIDIYYPPKPNKHKRIARLARYVRTV